MNTILANITASITELKKSPSVLIENAGKSPIAILNHNKPSAYLVPSSTFEKLMEIVDDYMLSTEVKHRLKNKDEVVEVNLDDL